jgi:hypothetical protein
MFVTKHATCPDARTFKCYRLRTTEYRECHDSTEYAVIISQVRLISTRRLRRNFRMPEDRFGEVLSALQRLIAQGT